MYSDPKTPLAWHATCSPVELQLVNGNVRAGFPSPADDFDCRPADLSKILIRHPQATFLIRGRGLSMVGAGINDGELLIVDRALHAKHKDIVCAVVDNMFTVKFLHTKPRFKLVAADPTFPDIVPKDFQEAHIWGVVTASITILTK